MLGPFNAFLSSVTWAIGSTLYTKLSEKHSPFAVNFNRAAIAFPLFLIFCLFQVSFGFIQFAPIKWHHIGWLFLSMIGSYGVGDSIFYQSSKMIGVPGAMALSSIYPLWTTLWGVFFYGDHINSFQWLSLAITLAGIGLVIYSTPQKPSPHVRASLKVIFVGVLLALITSLFWSLNTYAVSHVGKDLPSSELNSIRMFIGTGVTYFLVRRFAPSENAFFLNQIKQSSVFIFMFETFVGSFVFAYGLAHSPLILGSILTSLAPVLAVPAAWLLKTEKPTPQRTLGVILTVTGLMLLLKENYS